MTCEKIQDLIITDYLDGHLDAQWKKQVGDHLAVCPQCQEFFAVVSKSAVKPFVGVEPQTPPPEVWTKIKQTIEAGSQVPENSFVRFWDNFFAGISLPRPAIAFATVLTLVVMVGALTRYAIHPSINMKEQAAYLSQLADPSMEDSSQEGFGTAVEQYFL